MNERAAGAESRREDEPVQIPPWLRAAASDLNDLDFEAPIVGSITADCNELSDLYRAAALPADAATGPSESPKTRVFTMLSALAGMHFKPHERNEPFGPQFALADGSRTAIPSDFRTHVDIVADLAERAINPVLQARLADVSWLLDRKRPKLASVAILAYVEIVRRVALGELRYRFASALGPLQHDSYEYLRRALQIGRAIGWEKSEAVAARDLVAQVRKQAVKEQSLVPIHWFCELDLDFGVSDPGEIAADVDRVVAAATLHGDAHIIVDLWRLAARGYHLAKNEDAKNHCLSEAAERLVAEAKAKLSSAMLASHFLGTAIAQLSGVPGKKDRRTELRHQLIDLQARIPDEMSIFSQEMDLRELAEKIQDVVGRATLLDKLFMFASLESSPDPKKLADDAAEMIRKHPLSSLFPTSHHDNEGKVIHRTQGGDRSNDAIYQQIAQSESIRRKIVVGGKIEPARHTIENAHFLSDDVLAFLLHDSPFIPADLVSTFARGFARFFQGDFVSATYILIPLLENSLRHILKMSGHDVSKFDDATQTQEDRTINSLFEHMRTELDKVFGGAITTDIENVFLNKPGPYLRHAVAHGLLSDGGPYSADAIYGCWLIFRLCLLPLSKYRDQLKLPWDE